MIRVGALFIVNQMWYCRIAWSSSIKLLPTTNWLLKLYGSMFGATGLSAIGRSFTNIWAIF